MYAIKLETLVGKDHRVELDLPASFPVGEAEIIVLAKSGETEQAPQGGALEHLLGWLDTLPPGGRSREDIDAQIREERDSWGD